MANENQAEALAWIDKAEQDLKAAKILHQNQGPSTVGCYLCQRTIEKLLKAILVLHGEAPPRSHDLVDLHRCVTTCGFALSVSPSDLSAWTDYAVASRYPGFGDVKADTDFSPLLTCATKLAQTIRAFVEQRP